MTSLSVIESIHQELTLLDLFYKMTHQQLEYLSGMKRDLIILENHRKLIERLKSKDTKIIIFDEFLDYPDSSIEQVKCFKDFHSRSDISIKIGWIKISSLS